MKWFRHQINDRILTVLIRFHNIVHFNMTGTGQDLKFFL